jgi:hypothetical protein
MARHEGLRSPDGFSGCTRDTEDIMFKLKTLVLVAMAVGALALWATTSIFAESGLQAQGSATARQVDTFGLMAKAGDLPVQSFDAF